MDKTGEKTEKEAGILSKKDKNGIPDPLHFELSPHVVHLAWLIYIIAVLGAILCLVPIIMFAEEIGAGPYADNLLIVEIALIVVFVATIVEKTFVAHKHKAQRS